MDEQKMQDIWKQWKEKTKYMEGYVLAELTDCYIVDNWPVMRTPDILDSQKNKVLELRIFNEDKEVKLFRGDIGSDFRLRVLDEENEQPENYYDEEQFLDIDTKRSAELFKKDNEVYTTGGGRYYLPLSNMNDAKIVIRYHLGKYEDSGQVRIKDWRVVRFKEG